MQQLLPPPPPASGGRPKLSWPRVLAISATTLLLALTYGVLSLRGEQKQPGHVDIKNLHVNWRPSSDDLDLATLDSPATIRRLSQRTTPPDLLLPSKDKLVLQSTGTTTGDEPLRLLMLSKSKASNRRKRDLGRVGWISWSRKESSRCWCALDNAELCTATNSVCRYGKVVWAHRFVVGVRNLPPAELEDVRNEISNGFDILAYPKKDVYQRLTWKTVWMLRYINEHVDLDFLVFLDDDCFVQLWRMVRFLQVAPHQGLYAGHVEQERCSVPRGFPSRWHISMEQYNESHFPRYPWGAGIILSKDIVHTAVKAATKWPRPWFNIEDAFLGVILNSSGVTPLNIPQIYLAGLYKCLGCEDDIMSPATQPLIIGGSEKEILQLLRVQQANVSLCTVLQSPLRTFLRLLLFSRFRSLLMFSVAVSIVVILLIVLFSSHALCSFMRVWLEVLIPTCSFRSTSIR